MGTTLVAVLGLLIAVPCCGAWALSMRAQYCGAWAELLCRMWTLPGERIEPVSPTLADGFLTTGPSGKSSQISDTAVKA